MKFWEWPYNWVHVQNSFGAHLKRCYIHLEFHTSIQVWLHQVCNFQFHDNTLFLCHPTQHSVRWCLTNRTWCCHPLEWWAICLCKQCLDTNAFIHTCTAAASPQNLITSAPSGSSERILLTHQQAYSICCYTSSHTFWPCISLWMWHDTCRCLVVPPLPASIRSSAQYHHQPCATIHWMQDYHEKNHCHWSINICSNPDNSQQMARVQRECVLQPLEIPMQCLSW